ncbi:hypothetical protein [Microbaculum marinum]|uniref:SnoaL-like domain-containing protein n=1 Tax=Microbaculum marinum TaxID=1764581 RepID=A0AAW9RMI1_9HYPH
MRTGSSIAALMLASALAAGSTGATMAQSRPASGETAELARSADDWPDCRGRAIGMYPLCRVVPKAFPDITDVSHSSLRTANTITGFFEAKSRHKAAQMVAFFAPRPDPVVYLEAGLGFAWESQDALLEVWSGDAFANGPPEALSYPLRIVGGDGSAIVEFVNTPELLGREYRFIASITFDDDGNIIRWADYWDGRASKSNVPYGALGPYPADFRDDVENSSKLIRRITGKLHRALRKGDAAAAAAMFSPDGVLEDVPLHARIVGRIQIGRYFERALPLLPYARRAAMGHVSGGDFGGGYEWIPRATANNPLKRGITLVELDDQHRITRMTTMYDAYKLSEARYHNLFLAAAEDPAQN